MSTAAREMAVGSLIVPFVVAALIVLAARLLPERRRLPVAGAAIALGFVVAYVSVRGIPALPPRGAAEKLPLLVLIAWAAGALLLIRRPRAPAAWIAVLFALALVWLAWPRLDDAPARFGGEAVVLWAAGAIGLVGLGGAGSTTLRPSAMLVATSLGLVGAALSGRVIYVVELALAVAAILAAVAIARRPGGVPHLTPAAHAPGATALLALAAVLAFYSDAAPWLLGLAWLPLLADRLGRLARTRRRERWLFALLCAGPPALAVIVGRWMFGPLGY